MSFMSNRVKKRIKPDYVVIMKSNKRQTKYYVYGDYLFKITIDTDKAVDERIKKKLKSLSLTEQIILSNGTIIKRYVKPDKVLIKRIENNEDRSGKETSEQGTRITW